MSFSKKTGDTPRDSSKGREQFESTEKPTLASGGKPTSFTSFSNTAQSATGNSKTSQLQTKEVKNVDLYLASLVNSNNSTKSTPFATMPNSTTTTNEPTATKQSTQPDLGSDNQVKLGSTNSGTSFSSFNPKITDIKPSNQFVKKSEPTPPPSSLFKSKEPQATKRTQFNLFQQMTKNQKEGLSAKKPPKHSHNFVLNFGTNKSGFNRGIENPRLSLQDFIRQEKIGSGSFGKVYRIKKKNSSEIYAAKISIEEVDEKNSDNYNDLQREVNIICKLNHPAVLKFILFSKVDFNNKPKPVIITEYSSNGSLSRVIEHDCAHPNNKYLNGTRKLIIIYGVVSAMAYLHLHSIIHRDLKPDNVLLDDYLFPKVADFGLSKSEIRSNLTETSKGIIKGTFIYMAPEILRHSKYSEKSDVYAFALLLYELMTLQNPYPCMNNLRLQQLVVNGNRPEFNVEIPLVYQSLIEKCWSQDPKDRPTFDQILSMLRNDRSFITNDVNEDQYLKFVRYIDESKVSFNLFKIVIGKENNAKVVKRIHNYFNGFKYFPYKYFKNLNKENRKLVKEADTNDAEKQYEVGRNLIEGRHGFPIDVKYGLDYLKRSRKQGNNESKMYYIDLLIKGQYIPRNIRKIQKIIQCNFTMKNPLHFFYYGQLFKQEKRYINAKDCFKRSINRGSLDALYEYTEMLRKGYIKPQKSDDNYYNNYKVLLEKGHLKAMVRYGIYLINSKEEEKKEEGQRLIKLAADKGCLKAMYYYGQNSIEHLKKAAFEGHVKSMLEYGIKALKLYPDLPKDENITDIISYIKKSSDKGNSKATYEYGKLFINGKEKGIPIDFEKGSKFVEISALNGVEDSYELYATLLEKRRDDIYKSETYYELAIKNGNDSALYKYALFLKNKNEFDYLKYIQMAIDKGNSEAMNDLADWYLRKVLIKRNEEYNEKIVKYYKMAIDKENIDSMLSYAKLLYYGKVIEKNVDESIKYFSMAINRGNSDAMELFANIIHNDYDSIKDNLKKFSYNKIITELNGSSATYFYATLLQYGVGVKANQEESEHFYNLSINKGNASAKKYYSPNTDV